MIVHRAIVHRAIVPVLVTSRMAYCGKLYVRLPLGLVQRLYLVARLLIAFDT